MIRLDEKDASMDYAPRWIYDPSEDADFIRDEVKGFAASLALGVLILFAMIGAVTVARLFANAVTP